MKAAEVVGTSAIIGMDKVQKLINDIGKVPAKILTKATKTAATIVRNEARSNAPVDTGAMRRGLKLKSEKRRKHKRVYEVGFFGKAGKGEEFVRYSKSGKRAFYPASQEYGWTDQYGHRHEGKRFLRSAVDNNRENIRQTIMETMGNEIDKLKKV